MLDFNHPMAEFRVAAAWAEDEIMNIAYEMTIAPRRDRVRLRDACVPALETMRKLGREQFAKRTCIPPAIDALKNALARLAELPGPPEAGPLAQYNCPACGTRLKRLSSYGLPAPDHPTVIYCDPCLDIIVPSLTILRSGELGFGTETM